MENVTAKYLANNPPSDAHPLTAWLDREVAIAGEPSARKRRLAFAERIGVTYMALLRYENGLRSPKQPILDAIVKETAGEVDANAFLGKEAADVVSKRPPAAA